MANSYYATVIRKFYNEHLRDEWIKEHSTDPLTTSSTEYPFDKLSAAKAMGKMVETLELAEEYFDNCADADMDQDGYIPNKEMRLLIEVREALATIQRIKENG